MNLPKPDTRTLEALARLRNHPDFQTFVKHQQSLYDFFRETLVTANPVDVQRLQGRAEQLRDLLNLIKELK